MAQAGRLRFDVGVRTTFFITGTDTGAGKTVLTTLLAARLAGQSRAVAALKPLCSGGRSDAQQIHAALGGALTLDEINPWHFRAPIAPVLAARREKKRITLAPVLNHIRSLEKRFPLTLVEGAGGLLSPMGEDFSARELLLRLRARPIIVAMNRLGVVNHLRLTLAALPVNYQAQAVVVLMTPKVTDAATPGNAALLGEFFSAKKIFRLPWLGQNFTTTAALRSARIRKTLDAMIADQ